VSDWVNEWRNVSDWLLTGRKLDRMTTTAVGGSGSRVEHTGSGDTKVRCADPAVWSHCRLSTVHWPLAQYYTRHRHRSAADPALFLFRYVWEATPAHRASLSGRLLLLMLLLLWQGRSGRVYWYEAGGVNGYWPDGRWCLRTNSVTGACSCTNTNTRPSGEWTQGIDRTCLRRCRSFVHERFVRPSVCLSVRRQSLPAISQSANQSITELVSRVIRTSSTLTGKQLHWQWYGHITYCYICEYTTAHVMSTEHQNIPQASTVLRHSCIQESSPRKRQIQRLASTLTPAESKSKSKTWRDVC